MRLPFRRSDARWARRVWKAFGPGLITGAAGDDPSGIATYSQAGAQFGYALTWAMLLIGTGLLAVPVLAGSAAYALAEVLGLSVSLEAPAGQARGFYVILGLATIAGVALAALNLDPIAMLFWAAVINGIAAVPIMVAVMLLVSSPLGRETFRIPMWLRRLGWLAAALMTVAVALYFGSMAL